MTAFRPASAQDPLWILPYIGDAVSGKLLRSNGVTIGYGTLRFARSSPGNRDSKNSPTAEPAAYIDTAPVRFNDPRNEAQPETESLLGRVLTFLPARHAIKAVKDLRQVDLSDSHSGSGD